MFQTHADTSETDVPRDRQSMADAETSETDVAKNRQLIEASREGDLAAVMRLIKNKSPNLKPSTLSWPTPVQITSPHSDYTKHSQYPFSRFLNNSPSLPHLHPPLPKPPSPSPPPPPTPPLPPGPFPPVAPFCALQPLREGADVAYADVDAQGRTALMAAAEGGRAEVVRALLGEGAVWNAVDMGGKSAGDYAMEGVVAWGEGEGEEGEDESKKEEKARRQEVLDALIDAGTAVVCGVGKGGDEHGERGEKKRVGGMGGMHLAFPFLSFPFPSLRFPSVPFPFLSFLFLPPFTPSLTCRSLTPRTENPFLPFPFLPFPSFPSLPFPSLPFPSLPFPSRSFPFCFPLQPASANSLPPSHHQHGPSPCSLCPLFLPAFPSLQGGNVLNIGFGMGLIDTATVAATAVTNRRAALSTSSNRSQPLCFVLPPSLSLQGGDILNIGFGMGIIDTAIAARIGQSEGGIRSHTIVEAHPDVIARMKGEGWHEKEGVRVVEGRWQDVLPQLGQYDGIFFDTYGEYYDDLREFHSHLPHLLKPSGLYSFFNGMCGDNAFFHTVYCHIVALELQQHVGLTTQFIPLPVSRCLDGDTWAGVRHKYWQLDAYHLPVCYRDEAEEGEEGVEEGQGEGEKKGGGKQVHPSPGEPVLGGDTWAGNRFPSLFISYYVDDTFIVGPPSTVTTAFAALTDRLHSLGLTVQPSKCSIWCPLDWPQDCSAPSCVPISPNGLNVAGVPIGSDGYIISTVREKLDSFAASLPLLHQLHDPLTASRILSQCVSARPSFLLRAILDTEQTTMAQLQAFLPIRLGGFGLRPSASTAPLSYLCSWAQTLPLLSTHFIIDGSPLFRPFLSSDTIHRLDEFIPSATAMIPKEVRDRFPSWSHLLPGYPAKLFTHLSQQLGASLLEKVRATVTSPLRLARLTSLQGPHAGDWLTAAPSSPKLQLTETEWRIAAAIRLSLPIPHLSSAESCACGHSFSGSSLPSHALCCPKNNEPTKVHDAVKHELHRITLELDLVAQLEDHHLLPGR
ncbi:unnamed protein product [Closterium sp. NIES-53]